MATFNIEDAAFTGVGLLVKRPAAAIAWALVLGDPGGYRRPAFCRHPYGLCDHCREDAGPPATSDILAPRAPTGRAVILLMGLAGLVVGKAVISCAVYRAVFEPENSGFAYLRLGDQEIRVMVVNFIRGLLLFGINFTLSITLAPLLLLANSAGPATSGLVRVSGRGGRALHTLLGSVAPVSRRSRMTYWERRFRLFESWTLTRGLTLRLVAVGVIYSSSSGVRGLPGRGFIGDRRQPGYVEQRAAPGRYLQVLLSAPPAQWIGAYWRRSSP